MPCLAAGAKLKILCFMYRLVAREARLTIWRGGDTFDEIGGMAPGR